MSETDDELADWGGEEGLEGHPHDSDEEDDDESDDPVDMGPGPDGGDGEGRNDDSASGQPPGTVSPSESASSGPQEASGSEAASEGSEGGIRRGFRRFGEEGSEKGDAGQGPGRRRHRRGRRGGRFRRKGTTPDDQPQATPVQAQSNYPETYHEQVADAGKANSDRSDLTEERIAKTEIPATFDGRPQAEPSKEASSDRRPQANVDRPEFRSQRSRDRRIRQKSSIRPVRAQVNIQDLLKEGQEVLVQVAKDPIATKGARLTCHISLPGRHLVCMPTIDHVGVSRRIERDEERRRLREYVERNRPRNLGFIVRTASGKQQSEKRIKQDIEYLTRLWGEIREKAASVTAPALVYEDLNSVLRAIRDWVTEEIDKVIVDSRYHYNEILRFVSHFMPPLKQKVELYHGDIPIFDAYSISTELSRALERKVWLKSGGYIVIDQAEALVAIDVNTGRYVGKKNLEDTILKTNLEAVQEIAYQLRLRNCGGIIILDLIDMEKDENKHRVYRALEDALSRDRARPTILKISELGLVEMTRKRTRDTIIRTLCESCTHCEGKGFIKGKQTVAYEVMREIEREGIEREVGKILVQAHPEVIDILAIDERDTLDQLERRYRKQIYLQAVTDFHPEQFEVSADKRERAERGRDQPQPHREQRNGSNYPQHNDRNRNRDRDRERGDRDKDRHRHGSGITPTAVVIPVANDSGENPSPITPRREEGAPTTTIVIPVVQNAGSNDVGSSNEQRSDGNHQGPIPANKPDEFFDEEDRLAFLRAQAAQDAALARLGSGGGPAARSTTDPGRGDRGGAAGRRNPKAGRRGAGGKFRRGNDRHRNPPKAFGYAHPIKRNDQVREPIAPVAETNTNNDSSGGENSGGGGSSGSGGGEHSQPPV